MNPQKDPTLAAILSVLIPGLGQIYCRQWARGALFLAGAVLAGLVAPPLGLLFSIGIWIWGILDAYRIAKALQGSDQTGEGRVIDVTRLRLPSIDFRAIIPFVGIPLGILLVLVVVMAVVLTRSGFWADLSPGGTHKALIGKIQSYRAQTGSYPDSLDRLIDPTDPIERKDTRDRWGNPLIYQADPSGFKLSSAGPDGRPDTEDDIRYHP